MCHTKLNQMIKPVIVRLCFCAVSVNPKISLYVYAKLTSILAYTNM